MRDPELDDSNVITMDPALFPFLDRLAPGVVGLAVDVPGGPLSITTVFAEHQGNGDVRRYLDRLPRDRTVRFSTVVNGWLRGALERRGFVARLEPWEGDVIEWMVREASQA